MGCNSSVQLKEDPLKRVRYNVCSKNILKDIKYNDEIVQENDRMIKLLEKQLDKWRSVSAYKKLHNTKVSLEKENEEYSIQNDVLRQHSLTASNSAYLNSGEVISTKK